MSGRWGTLRTSFLGARVLLLVPRGGGGKGTGESHVQLGSQQTCGLI